MSALPFRIRISETLNILLCRIPLSSTFIIQQTNTQYSISVDQQEILNTITLTRLNYFSLAGILELYRRTGSATIIFENKDHIRDILPDATPKLVETLKNCALIAAEDTRVTRALLNHFGIDTPCVSNHQHNEENRAAPLIERMLAGEVDARPSSPKACAWCPVLNCERRQS